MSSDHYIEEDSLSAAWGHALLKCCARGRSEVVPLVVAITGFDASSRVVEDVRIRDALDALLEGAGKQKVETVANTIFPISLWNPDRPRDNLYQRYNRVLPRLKKASRKNSHGLYFERMTSGGPVGHQNQLEFAIRTFLAREGVRRSVLQVATFDPHRDHSAAAQRGFPCLQHLTFAPSGNELRMNAFYATQYFVERGYGNYLGLCRLGQFVAHELKLKLTRLTCFTGIAECDCTKRNLADVMTVLHKVLGPEEGK